MRFFFILLVSVLIFSSGARAQTFPFAQRQIWDGPYDIKMIAAPNLEAVYLRPGQPSGYLLADSVIKYSTMLMSGNRVNINNRYKGGSPFVTLDIPVSAAKCPNANTPCYQGFTLEDPDPPDCPVLYTGDVETVSKLASMTYTDYDTDLTTFSSSMAKLDISSCSQIQAAYLYWTGAFKSNGSDNNPNITLVDGPLNSFNGVNASTVFNATTTSGHNSIKFKLPGGTYQTVTATGANIRNSDSRYLCVADVTTMIQGTGGGEFWAANIQSYPNEQAIGDGGSSSGWILVVVFRSPLSSPRRISLWDGLESIPKDDSRTFTLTGLLTPSTSNFKSYVGFGALDGENIASWIEGTAPEGLGFQTAGGSLYNINPFQTDQPHYKLWTDDGQPAQCDGGENLGSDCDEPLFDGNWCSVYDGVSSSHITSYDEVTDKNGNEIVRLPTNQNTLGLDVHHMKLPNGAIAPGATSASITVRAGPQGGTTPFLAYIAIERLQPKLTLTKTANVNTVATGGTITYTLKVTNVGNTTSSAGDMVFDTLDAATTFGSYTPSGGVTVATVNGNRQFTLPAIAANGFVNIVFTVNVLPYAGNAALYDAPSCKRTITNTAWVRYNAATAGTLTVKSNGDDCGIGEETRVIITGFTPPTPTALTGNACTYISKTVVEAVKAILATQPGVTTAMLDQFDIRRTDNVRVQAEDSVNDILSSHMPFKAYLDVTTGTCQQIYQITFSGCGILPVELISFTGWRNDNMNTLRWITASEKENNYFIIERSADGIEFTAIGTVQGHGNSTEKQTYRFDDSAPLSGTTYYRLKQVDFNGMFSYSATIAIDNGKQSDITIYPNPNNGSFTISLIAPEQSYKLDITDVEGRSIYSASGDIVPENVEVNSLVKGLYIVHFHIDNDVIVKKLVVY